MTMRANDYQRATAYFAAAVSIGTLYIALQVADGVRALRRMEKQRLQRDPEAMQNLEDEVTGGDST